MVARLKAKMARLPPGELNMPIVVINGQSLSWNAVLQQAQAGTALGRTALSQLASRGLI